MLKVKDIANIIEEFAPLSLQAEYDNCGLLYGNPEQCVHGVLVALDLNRDVVAEAVEKQCDMIISHHPAIFTPIKKLEHELPTHRALADAISNNIAVYAAHTNFDFARGGMNDTLMYMLGATEIELIDGDIRSARVGTLKAPCKLSDFAVQVGRVLDDRHITFVGNPDLVVRKFAAINGGGGSEDGVMDALRAGADVFLSGDFKYHVIRLAKDLGYAIINFGHFESEKHFVSLMTDCLIAHGIKEVYGAESLCNPYN